jgi:hypothetical protein
MRAAHLSIFFTIITASFFCGFFTAKQSEVRGTIILKSPQPVKIGKTAGTLFSLEDTDNHHSYEFGLSVDDGPTHYDQEFSVDGNLVFWRSGYKEWRDPNWNRRREEECAVRLVTALTTSHIDDPQHVMDGCQ